MAVDPASRRARVGMPLRVLLYSRVDPSDPGGVQAVFTALARFLRGRGHAVRVAWSRPRSTSDGDLTLDLPALVWRHGRPAPRALAAAIWASARLAWVLLRARPDVVNFHYLTRETEYFLLFKRLFRYRLVVSVHGSDVLRPKAWDAPALPRALAVADAVTAVSRGVLDHLRERYGVSEERVTLIRNGIDVEFWSARSSTPYADRRPLVLSAGRLHPVKGHDVLVAAFRRVVDAIPDARLVIAGEGQFRQVLEEQIRTLGLGSSVDLVGHQTARGVRDWMARARVYVLPSRSEGMPLSLLEAMAAGVPVVAARVGGVPEVLTAGTGIIVEPEDPTALGDAIAGVLAKPERQDEMSRQAGERVRAFAAQESYAAYERLMARLAGR